MLVDPLMRGLAAVASALNANDPGLAHIAAVHLRIPDLPGHDARDRMETADVLIKYARDEGGSSDWNPALHPRAGTPPNPGWFAPTNRGTAESSIRAAQNTDPTLRSDAPLSADDWVRLPPPRYRGQYIDELHDFVEWVANAKPEDERAIRAEIKRYYFDVGDIFGGQAVHRYLSDALEAGNNKQWRQEIVNDLAVYARTDPAEMGQLRLFGAGGVLAFPGAAVRAIVPQLSEEAGVAARGAVAAEDAAAVATPDRQHGNLVGRHEDVSSRNSLAVRCTRTSPLSTDLSMV